MVREMGKITIYIHRSIQDWCDWLSTLFDTSRSEIIEDMIRYVKDNDLEEEVWKNYAEVLEEAEAEAETESEEESESESEEEGESEEKEDLEEE